MDRTTLIDTVNAIFDTVDHKDWPAALALFDTEVYTDFTSLNGGEAATIPAATLVDGWRNGLHLGKRSFHLGGSFRVTVEADTATVVHKGYANNVLTPEHGGGFWEGWGEYTHALRRTESGWLSTGIAFDCWFSRGEDAVRTHTLRVAS